MSEPNVMEPTVKIRARVWKTRSLVPDPTTGEKLVQVIERWAIQQLWTDGVNSQWRDIPVFNEGTKDDTEGFIDV